MTRLTLPHNDTPPPAAQKLVDQLWSLTTGKTKKIDYAAIDSSALQELRIWADAQYEQLTDENSSNERRLQTARNLLPVAKILAKIGTCPFAKADHVRIEKTRAVEDLTFKVRKLSGSFRDAFPSEAAEIREFKELLAYVFVQPEPMLQPIDAMLQKPADEARLFFVELEKVKAGRNADKLAQFLAPNITQPKLKKNGYDTYSGRVPFYLTSLSQLKYGKPSSVLATELEQAQQQLTDFENSPAFLKHQAWLELSTKSALVERKDYGWFVDNTNLWAPKAAQTDALVKANGDLLLAEYVICAADVTAHKIAARELARIADAAAQAQIASPKLTPLRPGAVAVTPCAATKPNPELRL